MLRVAVLVGLPRVLFLNATCVREHELGKILGPRSAEDSPPIAPRDKARQVSHMVQMGVRQDDRIQALGRNRKLIPVSETQILEALKQSAVEQNLLTAVFEKVFGPCDGARSTKKCEFGHVTNDDIRLLNRSPSGVLLCPTWERGLSPQPSL